MIEMIKKLKWYEILALLFFFWFMLWVSTAIVNVTPIHSS